MMLYASKSRDLNAYECFLCDLFKKSSSLVAKFCGSLFVTTCLFICMYKLIDVDHIEPMDNSTPVFKDIVMPAPKPIEDRYKEPTLIEAREQPEVPQEVEQEVSSSSLQVSINTGFKLEPSGLKISIGSNKYPIAQYQSRASYPRSALKRGIEGYVDVQFDVDKQGKTQNIMVVGSSPAGVFERAAMKAVSQWKYQPKTESGTPVYFPGVKSRVRFEISD